MTDFKEGMQVRHRTRLFTGEVFRVVRKPLHRLLDCHVVVRVGDGPRAKLLHCYGSDLDPVDPAPQPMVAVHEMPAYRAGGRRVGGFVVIDGGRRV